MPDEVALLVLLLDQTDLLLLRVKLSIGGPDVAEVGLLLLALLLDLVQSVNEGPVQVVESMLLDLYLLIKFDVFVFLEVLLLLLLLLGFLLPREEVLDHLLQASVLTQLHQVALDGLLLLEQLVVPLRFVNALVQLLSPQGFSVRQHRLVVF